MKPDQAAPAAAAETDAAINRLKSQIAMGRGGIVSRIGLGRALISAGRLTEALLVLRDAVQLSPGVADAALALGEGLLKMGHLPTALAEFQRALSLDPAADAAIYALGSAWLEAGEPDRAIETLKPLVLRDGPYRASATGRMQDAEKLKTLNRSPPGYVRYLFDQFSAHYDRSMIEDLGYCAPAILRSLADLLMIGSDDALDILDLGCGTGLAGEAFKMLARRLDGVDLSPRMVEQAGKRQIYSELITADVEACLESGTRQYDLLLAADTLVYLGDLFPIFRGARQRLRRNGNFLFTVEKNDDSGFGLGPKRRYRHSDDYIRGQAELAGLACMGILDCSPRREAGLPVPGLAVALRNC
jgi:predicted TPR repeat methyltransferase